jgi:hypothetical protein
MFRNEREQRDIGFDLRLSNPSNPPHIEALNAVIETIQRDAYVKMAEWLKLYVRCPDYLALISDEYSLELVAEATFWAVKLGLEEHLAKMSYAEIRKFQPLKERFLKNTERSALINDVCRKLTKPSMSHEASYALGEAAWCVYMHHNTFKKLQDEEKIYDSTQTVIRSRL